MTKSLQMQASYIERHGVCAFDITLDCEDGAPVGAEAQHADLVVAIANQAQAAGTQIASVRRVGARVHPVDHPAFASDVQTIVGQAGAALRYLMIPKVESRSDVDIAVAAVNQAGGHALPLHVLIESPGAVEQAFVIASHPRVQSVSFGLMDFVSAHGGAIPSEAMTVGKGEASVLDQFHHPLVVRAKLAIASACHAHGKVPSHCVVTEFRDAPTILQAARQASRAFGYTRMWSIHPDQIGPILQAFAPDSAEVELAADIVARAFAQAWAPISLGGKLHDRASYRYFWQVLERAHQTGCTLPPAAQAFFATPLQ